MEEKFLKEILDIETREVFTFKGRKLYLDECLDVINAETHTEDDKVILRDLIINSQSIVKKTYLAKKEELIVRAYLAGGYNYVAKDDDGSVYFYIEKPVQHCSSWAGEPNPSYFENIDLFMISWEDKEPYLLVDLLADYTKGDK